MGYKLAGFDVIGCNEIDAKVNRCYVANHSPRYNFLEDIRTLRERERESSVLRSDGGSNRSRQKNKQRESKLQNAEKGDYP